MGSAARLAALCASRDRREGRRRREPGAPVPLSSLSSPLPHPRGPVGPSWGRSLPAARTRGSTSSLLSGAF